MLQRSLLLMVEKVLSVIESPRCANHRGICYTSVPSDPQIEICLAQLPAGKTNPLSAGSRSSQTKSTVGIAVGLLPYISIASVWQQRRPVIKDLGASHHRLCIDTSLCRTVALAELANDILRKQLPFRCVLA